jgi:pyrroloquinoline-quinone synthase
MFMDRISQLDALVSQFDLNSHPFYQDWRAGTLPVEKLRRYAAEYGRFVGTVATGWEALEEPQYAEEERLHERLWAKFQLAVGAGPARSCAHVDSMVTAAQNSYKSAPEAAGALYAFEAQQPSTSQSKLDGLKEHYSIEGEGAEYFAVHAGDVRERDLLRERVKAMTDEEFARCKSACALMCAAMWSGLDGVYLDAAA